MFKGLKDAYPEDEPEEIEEPKPKSLDLETATIEKLDRLMAERDLVSKQCKELQATLDNHGSSKET